MMKKLLSLLLSLLLLLSVAVAQEAPAAEPDLTGYTLPFDTKDLEGNRVTAEILKDYDLTMVNIWAVTCGYCIKEMPDLQALYEQLPENVNMLGLCIDADYYGDIAKQLVTSNKLTYLNLAPDETLSEEVVAQIMGTPTTIFLDAKGNIVGEPFVGAPRDVMGTFTKEINSRLDMLKK